MFRSFSGSGLLKTDVAKQFQVVQKESKIMNRRLHGYASTPVVGRLQCQTGLIINILIANFNPENPKGWDAQISGFLDPWIP